jgi:hypothetical protein
MLRGLQPGQRLSLSVFSFAAERIERFVFVFDRMEKAKGPLGTHVSDEVFGQSRYLQDLPMCVEKGGKRAVRIVLSADISPVFVEPGRQPRKATAKPARPSPAQSASATPVGTIMKGGNGKRWVVRSTKSGVRRWVPVESVARR